MLFVKGTGTSGRDIKHEKWTYVDLKETHLSTGEGNLWPGDGFGNSSAQISGVAAERLGVQES